jgi:hypothetical protein
MANKYESYETRLKGFNNRYKVNFSFEKYASQSLRQKNLSPALQGVRGIGNENRAYRNALLNLYKECVENMMQKKYESFNPSELLKDFEKLMNGYRDYCSDKKKRAPEVNGGWKGTEAVDAMKETLRIMDPKDKAKYAERQYWSGQLRLRDMKKFVQDNPAIARGKATLEQVAMLETYRTALLNIIENRAQGWGRLNLRRSYLEKKTCNILSALIGANLEKSIEADTIVEENVVPKAQTGLDKAAEEIKLQEKLKVENKEIQQNAEQKQSDAKVHLNMDFLSEKENIKEVSPKIIENKSLNKENLLNK